MKKLIEAVTADLTRVNESDDSVIHKHPDYDHSKYHFRTHDTHDIHPGAAHHVIDWMKKENVHGVLMHGDRGAHVLHMSSKHSDSFEKHGGPHKWAASEEDFGGRRTGDHHSSRYNH